MACLYFSLLAAELIWNRFLGLAGVFSWGFALLSSALLAARLLAVTFAPQVLLRPDQSPSGYGLPYSETLGRATSSAIFVIDPPSRIRFFS